MFPNWTGGPYVDQSRVAVPLGFAEYLHGIRMFSWAKRGKALFDECLIYSFLFQPCIVLDTILKRCDLLRSKVGRCRWGCPISNDGVVPVKRLQVHQNAADIRE